MKLLLISDIHARFLPPENRIDDDFFFDVILGKQEQVLQIADEHKCDMILQAGDLFDSPDTSKYVISKMMQLYRKYDYPMYTVMGQHDMIMRNWTNVNRTPTYMMQSAGLLQIVGLDGTPVDIGQVRESLVCLHGWSFEQDAELAPVEGAFNILLAHASVGTRPLFPGHILPSPREFVRNHPGFDLILVGDIHYTFEYEHDGCQIFNTGCMYRKTTKEEDREHKPCVFVYDIETRKYEKIFLDIKPWPEVFHISEESTEADDSRLQEFIEIIKSQKKVAVKFTENLREYYRQNEVAPNIKSRIAQKMAQVNMSSKELAEVA